jgi:hypothetical protein
LLLGTTADMPCAETTTFEDERIDVGERAETGVMPGPASAQTNRYLELQNCVTDPGLRRFAVAIAILTYAVELSSFTLSIDEELHAFDAQPWRLWLGQGRWTMALLSYVFPPMAAIPFLPTAIFCAGLVLSALLLAGCLARSRAEAFAFVGFFVSCPVWLHIAEFNTLSWGFGAGLCLAAGSVALLHSGGYRASITAGVATSLALGIHQSLFALVLSGALLSLSVTVLDTYHSEPPSPRAFLSHLGPVVMCCAIAILLYYGVTHLVLLLAHQTLAYVDSFIRLTDFTFAATASVAVDRIFQRLSALCTGADATFIRWRWGIASLLLAWMGALAAVVRTFPADGRRLSTRLFAAILVLGSAFAAVAPLIASAGFAPMRALSGLPILYAAGAASMMKNTSFRQVPHWLIFSFAILINAWISASLFNSDALARDRDRILAGQLAERIAALPGVGAAQPHPLILSGYWTHESAGPALRVEIFGTSFFEHDRGQPARVASYLRLLGIPVRRPQKIALPPTDIAAIDNLPSWPATGSVTLLRDYLVIKFGPFSSQQRAALSP